MGIFDKFSNWISATDESYVENQGDEFNEDFDYEPGQEETPVTSSRAPIFHSKSDKSSNVVSINSPKPTPASKPKVVFQKIDRFEDVNKVADILKEKRIVVLNLESCPNAVAQRIIDVLYGVSYANDGEFKKVAGRAYIITPANVSVTGELGEEAAYAFAQEDEF